MKTMYRAWGFDIDKVSVIRSTEKSVWIQNFDRGRRQARHSEYRAYFDTWKEAHEHLINKASREIDSATRKLERANNSMDKIMQLKEGEEE